MSQMERGEEDIGLGNKVSLWAFSASFVFLMSLQVAHSRDPNRLSLS
jgi:hypothetical protein